MAPPPLRQSIAKERFSVLFPTLRPQVYHDPASRGPSAHSVRTIAWNPTGHLIATGSANRTLRIWNPDKPQVKNSTELRGHTGAIECVAWDPTREAELASISSDGTCRFWDVRSKTCTATIKLGGEGLTATWAGDGSGLVVGRKDDYLIPITMLTDTTATTDDIPSDNAAAQPAKMSPVAGTPVAHHVQTNQLVFSATSPPKHLFATRGDGSVSILDWPSMHTIHTLHAHTSACLSIALSPTGRYLAIGGSDALISLYDTYDWVCKRTVTSAVGAVKTVSFSWDGSYIIGGCDEGNSLDVVHVETGESVGKVDIGANSGGGQVAWHPSKYWVAYAGEGIASGLRILGAAGGQL